MKYEEFREYLTLNEIPFRENEEKLKVTYHVEISKIEERLIIFVTDVINFPYEFELIKKAIELAETPLAEREEEKKYYLKHRFTNTYPQKRYVNLVTNEGIILSDCHEDRIFQAKFTKAEIEELKVEFDIDLDDFELIEAED